MGDIFLKTLNMSIAASWLILAVVLLRFVLKKAPKWIAVLLWGIVALRLVVPFSFESALSLIPSAETFNAHNIQYETPAISSGIPAVNHAVNPVLGETFAPNPAGSVNPLYGWTLVVSVIWFIGIAAMLLYAVISYVRVRRSVAERAPYEESIFLCDHVKFPFILGLVQPKIYLPSSMDTTAIEPVIAHEKAHLARHDHWWKPLGFLILSVHWFNPLCWAAYVLLCRDIELACDERVIRQMDLDGKKQYSTALLECSTGRRLVTICPLAFGEVGVKERVKNVLHYKKPAFWIIAVAIIACAVVTVCFATNPTRSQEICVDGALYVQSGDNISELPDGSLEIGTLKSVLHHTNEHPTEHLSSANLNEKYAGCPVYQSSAQKDVIYLQDFAGFYIPFVCNNGIETQKLTLDDVVMLSQKGDALSWSDFERYQGQEIGSGLYIMRYDINELFEVWVGGVPDETPWYIYLRVNNEADDRIDIRTEDVPAFIEAHRNDVPKTVEPTPDGGGGPAPEEPDVSTLSEEQTALQKSIYSAFLSGDRTLISEEQLNMWYIPAFHNDGMDYEYTYLDLDGDGTVELLIQLVNSPQGYNGVFHFENGQIFCWNSDWSEGSCFDYPLNNGTMVRQYDFNGTRSYQLFQYKQSGEEEHTVRLFAREELIPEDSSEPCPYYEIDGKEVDADEFNRQLALLVDGPLMERTAWTPLGN